MEKFIATPPAIIRELTENALADLAHRIRDENNRAMQSAKQSLEHVRNMGELLADAKRRCKHGEFLPWLEKNVDFSPRTAQKYMAVAERWDEVQAKTNVDSHLSLQDVYDNLFSASEPETTEEHNTPSAKVVNMAAGATGADEPDEPAIVVGKDVEQYATERAKVKQEGRPTPEIAEAVGVDHSTVVRDLKAAEAEVEAKAKAVVAAAADAPEWFGDLLDIMDTESVDAAFKELKARQAGEEKPAEVLLDMGHQELPPQAVQAFSELPFVRKLLAALDRCVKDCEALMNMPIGRYYHATSLMQQIRAVRQSLHSGRPAYVCPYCRGKDEKCTGCNGGGWVTVGMFKQAPPEMQTLQPVDQGGEA